MELRYNHMNKPSNIILKRQCSNINWKMFVLNTVLLGIQYSFSDSHQPKKKKIIIYFMHNCSVYHVAILMIKGSHILPNFHGMLIMKLKKNGVISMDSNISKIKLRQLNYGMKFDNFKIKRLKMSMAKV